MAGLKDLLGPAASREIASALLRAWPKFPDKKFLGLVLPQLPKRELKDRVKLIASALAESLPKAPEKSFPILLRAIESEKNPSGLSGFRAWPLTQFVEDQGLAHPNLSLETLKTLTAAMSAEFAIRPFLIQHEELSLRVLQGWVKSENVHVRRLASEGSRPRLPWGQRIPRFQKNPEACISLLRDLRLDPEIYVRKSVANHLNDFSKDHPDWLVAELAAWKAEHPERKEIQWIIRHACRSLIKAGHPGALALIGIKAAKVKNAKLALKPSKLKIGQSLKIEFSAVSERKEEWLIDYAVHHRKSNGGLKPKVFKWTRIEMKAGERCEIRKNHKIVPITTRKYYPGKHEVEIFVNGKSVAQAPFTLVL
jgi:3-methyladenine DNA glycosylase AlkC